MKGNRFYAMIGGMPFLIRNQCGMQSHTKEVHLGFCEILLTTNGSFAHRICDSNIPKANSTLTTTTNEPRGKIERSENVDTEIENTHRV